MALSREKYRRVPDLYVVGKVHVLKDDTPMWLQAINPLQRQECQSDASIARARLVKALKSDHGSEERLKVEGMFWSDGRDDGINRLVNIKASNEIPNIIERIKNDPEWAERLEIIGRSADLLSRPAEESERALIEQYTQEYLDEINDRRNEETEYLRGRFGDFTDDQLVDEYVELYLDNRGNDVALAEYNLTEVWFAARCCEAVLMDDGEWDHSACENHTTQVYETKVEVRSLPEDLQLALIDEMTAINMSVRDAKNSDRQGSSSDSSPLPSEGEESTPSIQNEIHSTPPGSSSSQSDTP